MQFPSGRFAPTNQCDALHYRCANTRIEVAKMAAAS